MSLGIHPKSKPTNANVSHTIIGEGYFTSAAPPKKGKGYLSKVGFFPKGVAPGLYCTFSSQRNMPFRHRLHTLHALEGGRDCAWREVCVMPLQVHKNYLHGRRWSQAVSNPLISRNELP